MGAVPALEAAFALARMPTMAPHMREGPVPAGISVLLRIVAGEEGLAVSMAETHGVGEADLRRAAEFYIQQIMLYPGAAPHRVLGLEPGASRDVARAHMRRLLLWLHPDRSAEEWRSAFAGRVLEAWRALPLEPPAAAVDGASLVAVSPQSGRELKRRPPPRRRPKLTWIPIPLPEESARRSRGAQYLLGVAVFIVVSLTPNDLPRAVISAFLPMENPVAESELRASVSDDDEAGAPAGGERADNPFGTLR